MDQREPTIEDDVRDMEILDAIMAGLTDPEICYVLCVTGGQVTAMREEWERGE